MQDHAFEICHVTFIVEHNVCIFYHILAEFPGFTRVHQTFKKIQ